MRRVVSLWLPDFATARLARADSRAKWHYKTEEKNYDVARTYDHRSGQPGPLALVAQDGNRLVLRACNGAAARAGLAPGLSLTDARALLPGLTTRPHDPQADARAAGRLAQWLERYTPWTALDLTHPTQGGAMSLWLDVTGCAHLFGGEAALLGNMQQRLEDFGYGARLGLADTPGMAWAAARFMTTRPDPCRIVASEGAREVLPGLPLEALRLSPSALELAERFGLTRIADLMALPRAGLARRFGPEIARRLAQALGEEREALSPRRPVAPYLEQRTFGEPIGDPEDIKRLLDALLEPLSVRLVKAGQGARRVVFTLYRVDGTLQRLSLGTSRPVRDPARLKKLFAGRLEEIDPGFGIETARLAVTRWDSLGAGQATLDGDMAAEEELPALIDRLGAKLGEGAVTRSLPRESHLPERAVARHPAIGKPEAPVAWPKDLPPRPVRIVTPAEPVEALSEIQDRPGEILPLRQFRWRRRLHRVVRAEGPERIAPEWWLADQRAADEPTRDYFRVEDEDGRRYWLYRAGAHWYLQGLFA